MGHALCLQEWTNITGVASQVVTQHNTHWADVAGYDMAAVYLEVSQCTGPQGTTPTMLVLQTAPDPDEQLFGGTGGTVATYMFSGMTPILGLYAIKIIARSSMCRYIRWQLTVGTVATSIHFRIWLNLNQAGW